MKFKLWDPETQCYYLDGEPLLCGFQSEGRGPFCNAPATTLAHGEYVDEWRCTAHTTHQPITFAYLEAQHQRIADELVERAKREAAERARAARMKQAEAALEARKNKVVYFNAIGPRPRKRST